MIWIVVLFSTVVALLDAWFYRRHLHRQTAGVLCRSLFWGLCLVSDLLPVVVAVTAKLLPDNSTGMMLVGMWLLWGFQLLVAPRFVYYLFRLLHCPRLGWVGAAAVFGLLLWGTTCGRTRYVIREVEVQSDRLPSAFDGLRIVQFSDLHIGTLVRPQREMERLVRTIHSLHPDLILFNGDLINIRYTELDSAAMRILSGLRAPLGVVSNLGNHDTGVYIKDSMSLPVSVNIDSLCARQRRMGWRLPDNATEYLVRAGDTITLTGVSFDPALSKARHDRRIPMEIETAFAGVPTSYYNITLSHLPQLWERIRDLGYGDLTLSGHVHAMQMKLNLGRWSFSPARLMYRRWSGRYDDELGGTLYINDGIGYVGWPMRLGAYPEITVITLKR